MAAHPDYRLKLLYSKALQLLLRILARSGTPVDIDVLAMKVAIPYWQGRVSPVLDVATRFLMVDLKAGREVSREDASLVATEPLERARELQRAGAETLICGAVSRQLEMALESAGVSVIPHTCGPVNEVLAAFVSGQLNQDAFLMPGCCGRRRRFASGRRRGGRCRRYGQKGGDDDVQR